MSTAAIRWQAQEQNLAAVRQPLADEGLDQVRFIWQCVEDLPHEEVMGGWIERCRVMPIVKRYRWESYDALSEDQREPGMVRRDKEGRIAEAAYSILPGHIFKTVMDQFEPRGVVEFKAIRGISSPQAFARLNIDGLFFPQRKDRDAKIDEIPRAYTAIRNRIEEVRAELVAGQHDYSPQDRAILIEIADQMLHGVQVARSADVALLDESERELELGRNNPQYKQVYDARDLRALQRLERNRKDYAVEEMAKQQNSVTELLAKTLANQGAATENLADGLKDALQSFAREFATTFAATQKQSADGYAAKDEAPAAPKPQGGKR